MLHSSVHDVQYSIPLPCSRRRLPKRHDQHVAKRRLRPIERRYRRHAVVDTGIVDERGVEGVSQRERTERLASSP